MYQEEPAEDTERHVQEEENFHNRIKCHFVTEMEFILAPGSLEAFLLQ